MRNLILIAFSLLLCSCYAPERNCKDFKTGTFEFESYLNGELEKTRFVRNDSIEVDYYKNNVDSSSVRWINDCEYILTNLNPKNMAEEKPLHMKILTTEKNSYTFEFSVVGGDKKQKGVAKRVE
ncbi:DNA topoisomerase IV [Mesonia sp. MT50]|uniref:DNA topoisomerase IV n=1 Tax=Mesonia profundi TaxID=3070998 RepID=A0ABU1A1Y2_9FLAO|nr:DNA topoisomerase IV [Mesonia profundi]MDQ7917682.1 DNA topoisomerase IV [Mesonia profundi]